MPNIRVPIIPSGSTGGRPIRITANSRGAAQTIHQVSANTAAFDFLDLGAYVTGIAPGTLYILWGSTEIYDEQPIVIQAGMPIFQFCEKKCFQGGLSLVVRAWTSAPGAMMLVPLASYRITVF